MAAQAFINQLEDYLAAVSLMPAPLSVGIIEPAGDTDLPALVLSLTALNAQIPGLGEPGEIINQGALPWSTTIDLANPVLADDPTVLLLSADRQTLQLPHGALVANDGSPLLLGSPDLQINLDGNPLTVVNGLPPSGQLTANPDTGQLLFGSPLPAAGQLTANYFIGRWQRQLERLSGQLDITVIAASSGDCRDLSNNLLDALHPHQATIPGVLPLQIQAAGSVTSAGTSHLRQLRWAFDYLHTTDRPESAGGVIRQLHLTSQLDSPQGTFMEGASNEEEMIP